MLASTPICARARWPVTIARIVAAGTVSTARVATVRIRRAAAGRRWAKLSKTLNTGSAPHTNEGAPGRAGQPPSRSHPRCPGVGWCPPAGGAAAAVRRRLAQRADACGRTGAAARITTGSSAMDAWTTPTAASWPQQCHAQQDRGDSQVVGSTTGLAERGGGRCSTADGRQRSEELERVAIQVAGRVAVETNAVCRVEDGAAVPVGTGDDDARLADPVDDGAGVVEDGRPRVGVGRVGGLVGPAVGVAHERGLLFGDGGSPGPSRDGR